LEVTPEEEDEIIKKTAQKIQQYGFNAVGVIVLETIKPTAYVGGFMGRFFVSPLTIVLSTSFEKNTEKFFMVFQKRENIDKLIKILEEDVIEKEEAKEKEKEQKKRLADEEPGRKGWRRYLPF